MKQPPTQSDQPFPVLGDYCKVYVYIYHRFTRLRPYLNFPVNKEPITFLQKHLPKGGGWISPSSHGSK